MNGEQLNFISNNVKGLQGVDLRTKLFDCLKNRVHSNGFVFLQETHSSQSDEKNWSDEFQSKLFFLHSRTNSCGVAIGFFGSKHFALTNQMKGQK